MLSVLTAQVLVVQVRFLAHPVGVRQLANGFVRAVRFGSVGVAVKLVHVMAMFLVVIVVRDRVMVGLGLVPLAVVDPFLTKINNYTFLNTFFLSNFSYLFSIFLIFIVYLKEIKQSYVRV